MYLVFNKSSFMIKGNLILSMNSIHKHMASMVTIASILFLFAFRVYFGLNLDFWNDDERHVYLIGLDWFTSGNWPYFGPDVIHTNTMIPGALQGLLVAIPLFVLPIPEAPILFLNVFSMLGLAVFTLYCLRIAKKIYGEDYVLSAFTFQTKKPVPSHLAHALPFIFVFAWISLLPWTLEFGTHVYNPSYLLTFALLFYVGFFEQSKALQTGLMSLKSSSFIMGLCLGSIMQLHLSWPLLTPLILIAFLSRFKDAELSPFKWVLYFTLGAMVPSLLLMPTLLEFGLNSTSASATSNIHLNWSNLTYIHENFIRVICYATYEVGIFLGGHEWPRERYLLENPSIIPFALFLIIFGLLQVMWLVYGLYKFLKSGKLEEKYFACLLVALWLVSTLIFLLSSRPPVSRNFYLLLPISLVFSFLWILKHMQESPRYRSLMLAALVSSLFYQGILSYGRSQVEGLYLNRSKVVDAIEARDSSIFETFRFPQIFKKS